MAQAWLPRELYSSNHVFHTQQSRPLMNSAAAAAPHIRKYWYYGIGLYGDSNYGLLNILNQRPVDNTLVTEIFLGVGV